MPGTRSFRTWTPIMTVLCVCVMLSPAVSRAADGPVRPDALRFSTGALDAGELDSARSAQPQPRERMTGLRSLPTTELGFMRSYLLPRLSSQFDVIAPRHPILDNAADRVDHVLYDDLTDAARRQAERGARKALKNFLIDTTALGKRFRSGRRDRSPSTAGPSRPSSSFGLGISGGRLEAEWRYRTNAATLGFRVTARGSATMSFSHSKLNQTSLAVGYSSDGQRYDVGLRLSF